MFRREQHLPFEAKTSHSIQSDQHPTVVQERRSCRERRRFSWQAIVLGNRTPRRREVRRHDSGGLPLVDLYPPGWLVLVGLVLLLSAIDAVFTVHLLSIGAQELNPVMDQLLNVDVRIFALGKIGLTGLACATLLIIGHFPFLKNRRVSHVFIPIVAAYTILIGYELWMLGALTH